MKILTIRYREKKTGTIKTMTINLTDTATIDIGVVYAKSIGIPKKRLVGIEITESFHHVG